MANLIGRRRVCSFKNSIILLFVFTTVQLLKTVNLYGFLAIKLLHVEVIPDWVDSAGTMNFMNEKAIRCEVDDMGCFDLMKPVRDRAAGELQMKSCLDLCFRKGVQFAGVKGKDCFCEKAIDKFVTGRFCNAACSKSRGKECIGPNSIRVLRKKSGCFAGDAIADHSKYVVGCIPIPQNITGGMTVWGSTNMTITQCILKCESIERVLAIPILRYGICICSNLMSIFSTADDMQESMATCENTKQSIVSVYKTFAQECIPTRFLDRGQGPFTILTSYWGSGNTWLRHLIEVATGIYTGSVYMDNYLYDGGMLGEKLSYMSGQTIIIKDHIMTKPEKVSRLYKSAVLIVRNVYDASLAEFVRLLSHNNHTALLDPKIYQTASFRSSMTEMTPKWLYHAKMLFDLIKRVMVVYYEDLRQNSVRELRRVISFLPQDLVPSGEELERRLMCMKLDSTGNFKRASKGIESNPFDAEIRQLCDELIRKMNVLLLKNGQPSLPASYFEEWKL